jgi:Neprosin
MHHFSARIGVALILWGAVAVDTAGPSGRAQAQQSPASPNQTTIDPSGSDANAFVNLRDALDRTRTARFSDYAGRVGVAVESEKAFEEMRRHIIDMYEGVQVVSSFIHIGNYVDCITIESQPTVRRLGLTEIAKPPAPSPREENQRIPERGELREAESPLKAGLKDRFGNPIACPSGTIPMRRITLEMLTRYPTLRDFFSKEPKGSQLPGVPERQGFLPDWDKTHLHAYADQYVDNYGGNSWLDLWNPTGDLSISQHWYSSGSGSSTETVEGGWQVLPSKYNTNDAVLFIYWTADDYNNTGCYNLDCSGFVQISSDWYLGGTWTTYSSTGDGQWGFQLQWKLYNGNWWLFLKGGGNIEAVGYYPTSLYNGGQMSQYATRIAYGGEVARQVGNVWPQMGSGAFAGTGWEYAAYQNSIFYIPQNSDDGVGTWASLTTHDEAFSTCYTVNYTSANSGGSWGSYIYFGGPGANSCN